MGFDHFSLLTFMFDILVLLLLFVQADLLQSVFSLIESLSSVLILSGLDLYGFLHL